MRKKYVLGNWKMNHGVNEIKEYFDNFTYESNSAYVGVCPQTLHLEMAENLSGPNIKIGAQNCAYENSGAFTGEASPVALKELGVDFTLVGHSERRQFFGETNESCLKRIEKAHENKLLTVYCIGESLEEFEAGKTLDVLTEQLKTGLFPILDKVLGNIVIAYEPVWAIGTGKTATVEIITEVSAGIRKILGTHSEPATGISLLYGGSVKPANSEEIAGIADVDGVLVGGASLKVEDFEGIAKAF